MRTQAPPPLASRLLKGRVSEACEGTDEHVVEGYIMHMFVIFFIIPLSPMDHRHSLKGGHQDRDILMVGNGEPEASHRVPVGVPGKPCGGGYCQGQSSFGYIRSPSVQGD